MSSRVNFMVHGLYLNKSFIKKMCVRDMLDTLKSSNLHIIGDSEKEEP